ncbi:MAG: TrmH family RNA methyltransferase [Fimbriimonadales bacterium]
MNRSLRHRGCAEAERPLGLNQILPLLDRNEREQTGLFWAEGCRSFFSALEHRWMIRTVVYCPKLLRSRLAWDSIHRLGMSRSLPIVRLCPEEFQLLTRRAEPDGIGVVCEQRWSRLIDQHPVEGDVWVALDSIRTPGNLGTILRTCAATGAQGVMLIGGEVDAYDPAVIRASMGTFFATNLIRTSARALAGWKSRRNTVLFIGTSPSAKLDYRQLSYQTPLVLMMGSERTGLRERQSALCDRMVRLPMTDQVDSLNLAVATGLMLYEAVR